MSSPIRMKVLKKNEYDSLTEKLIENNKRIEDLTTKLAATSKELGVVKGKLTKAYKRIEELENKQK